MGRQEELKDVEVDDSWVGLANACWISLLFWTIFVSCILAYCNQAGADELRIGAGKNCGVLYGDGIWQQTNAGHEIEKCGGAIEGEYIFDTKRSLLGSTIKFGANIFYGHGMTVRGGNWWNDNCYMYHVRNECSVRNPTDKVSSVTKAVGLSIYPTWRPEKDTEVYIGAGVSYFDAYTKVERHIYPGQCGESGLPACNNDYHVKRGPSLVLTMGGTYKAIYMKVRLGANEHGEEDGQKANFGILMGVRMEI